MNAVVSESVAPEVVEATWRQLGVTHRVRNVLVPEVLLNAARVVTIVGQLVTASMAQHVRMHREWNIGDPAGSGYNLANR